MRGGNCCAIVSYTGKSMWSGDPSMQSPLQNQSRRNNAVMDKELVLSSFICFSDDHHVLQSLLLSQFSVSLFRDLRN